jgi:hypothetical protein
VALTALSLLLLALNLSHPNAHIFDWWLGNAAVVIDVTVGVSWLPADPRTPWAGFCACSG